jgi:lipooligosaccharide transport system permease protein
MTAALRIVQRNALVYRRVWRGSLFFSFLQPSLFLVSMGLGVGALVSRGGATLPGGVSFLTFLAPGLLASTCMQTAMFESSFPIMGKMTWRRNYEAICATPVSITAIVVGEILWVGVRLLMVASAFGIVLTASGIVRGQAVVPAVAAAVLTGLAFSAAIIAYAGTVTNGSTNFNALFRFVITPLFLFSGVFFPITRLPWWLQRAAPLTPLYHGVELVRGVVLQTIDVRTALGHLTYLAIMLCVGTAAAYWTFARRLMK